MKKRYDDFKYMWFLILALIVVAIHLLLGYPTSVGMILIMTISFITVYIMHSTCLGILWDITVILDYIILDIMIAAFGEMPIGTYRHMLTLIMSSVYCVILCIAVTRYMRKTCDSTVMNEERKLKRINSAVSVVEFNNVLAGILITIHAIINATHTDTGLGIIYITSTIVELGIMILMHVGTRLNARSFVKNIKANSKEANANECHV